MGLMYFFQWPIELKYYSHVFISEKISTSPLVSAHVC